MSGDSRRFALFAELVYYRKFYATMFAVRARIRPLVLPALVGVIAFALYVRTLAPTLTWAHDGADGGDLITAAVLGGIAHPPGYPLYLLLARVFLLLPAGDPALRLNLMSAFWGAASAGCLSGAIRLTQLPVSGWKASYAAFIAALLFALAPIPWDQAVIAEVYTLHTFLSGLVLTQLILLGVRRPRAKLFLVLTGLTLGLAAGSHLTVLWLVPALGLALWQSGYQRAQDWTLCLVGFLGGLSIYLYLPLQAARAPLLMWGDATTPEGFWWLVSAEPYRQFVLALPLQYLPQRLLALAQLWIQQYNLIGLALGVWGWARMSRKMPNVIWPLTAATVAEIVYALFYNTTDAYVYLLPALWVFAIWIAWGLADAFTYLERSRVQWRSAQLGRVLVLASLWLPIISLGHYADADLSQDRAAEEYGQQVLQEADANAILIADTDAHLFALWYYHLALGERPDLTLVAARLYPYAWYRAQLARHNPSLAGTDQASLLSFVQANAGVRSFNLTDPVPELNPAGLWHRYGLLGHLER